MFHRIRRPRPALTGVAAIALTLGLGAMATPTLAASDDCATRVSALETTLGLEERQTVDGVTLIRGDTIEEAGGETTYAETGPATPRENWFGSAPKKAAALKHLETAIEHREQGDMKACNRALDMAHEALDS